MTNTLKKYFIRTFGCAANEADSERLAAVLEKQGHKLVSKIEEADIVVINTCSVRESAENRVFGLVNKLTKSYRHTRSGRFTLSEAEGPSPGGGDPETNNQQLTTFTPRIVLTGCMVGSARGDRRRYSLVQLKRKLPGVDEFKTIEELLVEPIPPKRLKRISALVPIMEGCDHFCTYCVVPYARGEEISRPFAEIVQEVKDLVERGYREITLIGQNVNSYGKKSQKSNIKDQKQRPKSKKEKEKRRFSVLLKSLHAIPGITKISFLTSNPWDLTDDIIGAMSLPKIDRYLHLALQSGDDEVLRRMNRGYTAKQYLNLVKKIRRQIPDIKIGTDIIVGFPGETEEAFQNTVKLCRKIKFVKAYVSRYSVRPGTTAAKFKDDVSAVEKKRRWRILDGMINKRNP